MSVLMSARRSEDVGEVRPRNRLVSGELAMVIVASVGMLTSFDMLLAVLPKYAAAAGAGSGGAGLVTGVLLSGTVVAELASAALMRRHGYLRALVAGAALLGAPTLALLASGSLAIMVAVSFVRGFGFGLSGVAAGALVAELLPPDRRGEGLGLYGALDSAPGIVALPLGIWLADHYGFALVVVIAATAALAPMAAFRWLRRATASLGRPDGPGGTADSLGAAASAEAAPPAGLVAGLRNRGQLRFALIFVTTTVAAGIVASFLPLARGISANTAAAGLLAQALTATVSRWWAGRYGDRRGHERLLVPGLVMAALGMIAMLALTLPVAVMAGMCVFGTGFGMVQNATLALMMERVPASGIGAASALWNLAYDTGYGAGPAAFGLFVAHTGYPAGLALTGIPMIAALPLARLAGLGRRRRRAVREPADLTSGQLVGQMSSRADVEKRRLAPTTRCEATSASLSEGVR